MKQTATLEIKIPDKNDWTVADIQKALRKHGIKCEVTAVFNHLKLSHIKTGNQNAYDK